MNSLRVTAQQTVLPVVKRLNVRLRKIRSLKTSVLANKPFKPMPVTARAPETQPLGTMSDPRP
jgi:hypothetical protein